MIIFSAALPFQGGTNHINEQEPQYWIEKFNRKGYEMIDCIRYKIWNNKKVERCYRNNIFVFIKKSKLKNFPKLQREKEETKNIPVFIIHPEMFLPRAAFLNKITKFIPLKMLKFVENKVNKYLIKK